MELNLYFDRIRHTSMNQEEKLRSLIQRCHYDPDYTDFIHGAPWRMEIKMTVKLNKTKKQLCHDFISIIYILLSFLSLDK
jgi:hypothetical protein